MFEQFCENRMFGKILVLDLWPKMVLTNQITRFFKFEYLKSGLAERLEKYHSNILFFATTADKYENPVVIFLPRLPLTTSFYKKGCCKFISVTLSVRPCVRASVRKTFSRKLAQDFPELLH